MPAHKSDDPQNARRGRNAPGLAVLHGDWVIEPATGTGSEIETRGLSTEVVRKQPDGPWLFVIDNPYTPEPSQSIAKACWRAGLSASDPLVGT